MRKLLVIVVILTFFAPIFRPLAHSEGAPKVCSLKGKTCAMHSHSCTHEAGKAASHASHHEMEIHHKADGKKGGPVFKCGCGKDNTAGVLNIQEDPFVTGRLPMPLDCSIGLLSAEALLRDSTPFPPVIRKPPAA